VTQNICALGMFSWFISHVYVYDYFYTWWVTCCKVMPQHDAFLHSKQHSNFPYILSDCICQSLYRRTLHAFKIVTQKYMFVVDTIVLMEHVQVHTATPVRHGEISPVLATASVVVYYHLSRVSEDKPVMIVRRQLRHISLNIM